MANEKKSYNMHKYPRIDIIGYYQTFSSPSIYDPQLFTSSNKTGKEKYIIR